MSRVPILIACLLLSSATLASQWQHDLPGAGTVVMHPHGDLIAQGSGVALLAEGGNTFRFGQIAGADAPLTWQIRTATDIPSTPRSSGSGWIAQSQYIGFGFHGPCGIAARDEGGVLILRNRQISADRDCDTALLDAWGAVVVHGSSSVTALSLDGELLWQSVPVAFTGWRELSRDTAGALWLSGEVFEGSSSRPIVLRLNSSTGEELGRWQGESGARHAALAMRPTTNAGMQVVTLIRSTGSTLIAQLIAQEFNTQLQLQRSTLIAEPTVDSTTLVSSNPHSGIAVSWTQLAAPGSSAPELQVAALDPQLSPLWQVVVAQQQTGASGIVMSDSGRVALGLVTQPGSAHRLLRLRDDGSTAELVDLLDGLYRMVYAQGEHLWLSTRSSTPGSSPQLLRFDGDQPGIARVVELRAAGLLPEVIAASNDANGELRVLYSLAGAGADGTGSEAQPLRAITVGPAGIVQQADAREDDTVTRVIQTEAGWVINGAGRVSAQNHAGQLRWQRTLDLPGPHDLACRQDASCVRTDTLDGTTQGLIWMDSEGADSHIVPLPMTEPSTILLARDELSGELQAQIHTATQSNLYALQAAGTLQWLARWNKSELPGVLVGITHQQLLIAHEGQLSGLGNTGPLWSRPQTGQLYPDLNSQLWELSLDHSFGPINPQGLLYWQWSEPPFSLTGQSLAGNAGAYALSIAGQAQRSSWLTGSSDEPHKWVRLGIVSNAGQTRRVIDLPDATGPVHAMVTTAADESAFVLYPAASAGQPVLRMARIDHWLFRDGMED